MYAMQEDFFKNRGQNGIDNMGSTCYLNTMVQCFGHCVAFLRFVLNGKYRTHLNEIPESSIMMQLRDVYKDLWIMDKSVAPHAFIKTVAKKITFMDILEQNDINEFMMVFIDKLGSEIARRLQDQYVERSVSNSYDHQANLMDRDWLQKTHKDYNELYDLLHGQSINQISCGHCTKIHHNYEIFFNLMLPITDKCKTLDDCIVEYFQNEVVNGAEVGKGHGQGQDKSDLWKCDKCNTASKSEKMHILWKTPRVLVLSLKRFTSDMKKIVQPIQVPDVLDLSEYVLCKTSHKKYELKAVAVHMGSFFGGHYVAVCKNATGDWYLFDDETVRRLGPQVDLSQSYVCFYEALGSS